LCSVDKIDKNLLVELQRDCRPSVAELGEVVGLSASACHRRIKQLEADRIVTGCGARVDPKAIGYAMQLFIEVTLTSQKASDLDAFERAVTGVPEILECYLMAGGTDYLLRVVAHDVEDFERIHRERLAKMPHIARMQSRLTLRSVRAWTGYPVR
jgi:Lrp/AsnC family transcriptional regulator, leucine-responsive regulatory protein